MTTSANASPNAQITTIRVAAMRACSIPGRVIENNRTVYLAVIRASRITGDRLAEVGPPTPVNIRAAIPVAYASCRYATKFVSGPLVFQGIGR
jgi:hypothetical protein